MISEANMTKQERIEQMENYLCEKFHLPKAQVVEMLPNFVTTLASHMENIENALSANDLILLGKAGHTMKGALLNLGLHDCSGLALEIENKGKAEDTQTNFEALVKDLRKCLEPLIVS